MRGSVTGRRTAKGRGHSCGEMVTIIEGDHVTGYLLSGLMALAKDGHDGAGSGPSVLHRRANGLGSIWYLENQGAAAGLSRTGHDGGANHGWVLISWVVIGDDDHIGPLSCGRTHRRPLRTISIASGAHDGDEHARRRCPRLTGMYPGRAKCLQDSGDRLGRMGVVHHRLNSLRRVHDDRLHASGHFSATYTGRCRLRVHAGGSEHGKGTEGIRTIERAWQANPQRLTLPAGSKCHP